MISYFNGCSFTYGDELRHPETQAWPTLLAKSLGCGHHNDAISGGTNDRTVYKTFQNLDSHDCFFIAWTNYIRFTEYNPVDNFEINFNPYLILDASLHSSDDLKKRYWKYKDYGEMYYKHWYNELYEFKKWLQQIIMLQSVFDRQNKKYIMLNTMSNNLAQWLEPDTQKFISGMQNLLLFFDAVDDEQLFDEQKQIQKLAGMIDKSRFVKWNQWCISDLKETHACGPGGHLLESGHEAVAKTVLEHYNLYL
jgi:hypothetical protein